MLLFTCTSITSERDVLSTSRAVPLSCGECTDDGPSLPTDCTSLCRHRMLVNWQCRENGCTPLTHGDRPYGFTYSLLWHHNARTGLPTLPPCDMVVSFLRLDVTVSCEWMNLSEATRQLSRYQGRISDPEWSFIQQTLSLGCHIHNGTYLTLSLTLTIMLTLLTLTLGTVVNMAP